MTQLRFIDLFAGLGGFHLALSELGHQCVFASELNPDLQNLYYKNFGMKPHGDIRDVSMDKIPSHDILCAGFPCQPFSKAGAQRGFECPQWGKLFENIIQILDAHSPRYFIIENVPNLTKHKQGETWSEILKQLKEAGYTVADKFFSPHQFGVPQLRERAFIVGAKDGLGSFEWPEPQLNAECNIKSVLDKKPKNPKLLNEKACQYLEVWQKFLDQYPVDKELPSFPVWGMEFGADYPITFKDEKDFFGQITAKTKLTFGRPVGHLNRLDIISNLPPYARNLDKPFPKWKQVFINQNRKLYEENESWLKSWASHISGFHPSYQKFEWNCKGSDRSLWNKIIQFRASGIRVKRPNYAPSLVAMTVSQIPVIPWQKRYMTIRECSRLQSMGHLKHLPETYSAAAKALGNAVNAEVIKRIAANLCTKPQETNSCHTSPEAPLLPSSVSSKHVPLPHVKLREDAHAD